MPVTEGMEELRHNTSIATLMELVNALRADTCTQRTLAEGLVVEDEVAVQVKGKTRAR